jgi:transketolase
MERKGSGPGPERKYIGLERALLGIDRFGKSAPAGDLFKYFDFTVDTLVAQVKTVLFTYVSAGIRDYPN